MGQLASTVFAGNDVRQMTEADRRVIRASNDADGLLDLQLRLRSGGSARALGNVMVVGIGLAVITIVLSLVHVPVPILRVLVVGVLALFGVWVVLRIRLRRRILNIVGWLGDIEFRLSQLAAKG